MFGVFLCLQAFVHAHTHVFVLNKYVYVFVNGIKTFKKNIMNPAVKTPLQQVEQWYIFVFSSFQ